jgi:quercetin dioxygenase-like cupin family protein
MHLEPRHVHETVTSASTASTPSDGICLEGELVLTLDNEEEVTLAPDASVVQVGTRHAWENRSDRPALMCNAQIGAARVS